MQCNDAKSMVIHIRVAMVNAGMGTCLQHTFAGCTPPALCLDGNGKEKGARASGTRAVGIQTLWSPLSRDV